MAKKVKISDLPAAVSTDGLKVLGVDANNKSVSASMELLRGNKGDGAYQQWQQQPGNTGKTYAQYEAWLRQPATDAATAVLEGMAHISEEVNQVIADTEEAKDLALDVASHPTRIDSDCTVEVYDPVSKAYTKTDINVKGDKGNTMYATFHLDPSTGQLAMHTDPEYKGANFEIENGKLMVTL